MHQDLHLPGKRARRHKGGAVEPSPEERGWDHIRWKSTEKLCVLCLRNGGFPGGTVVRSLPANARGHGFEPWSGKILHAMEQLSPCATTTEPVL